MSPIERLVSAGSRQRELLVAQQGMKKLTNETWNTGGCPDAVDMMEVVRCGALVRKTSRTTLSLSVHLPELTAR